VIAILAGPARVAAADAPADALLITNPTPPVAFSHPRHAARGAAGKACAGCHGATTTAPIQRAPVAACTICHDGTAAFATTATCTRCHDAAPPTAWSPPPPGTRFSHASHGAAATACTTCHALAASGEPTVAGHAACAGCHLLHPGMPPRTKREETEEPVCTACHEGTEPWRHLVADRPPPDDTEVGASLDHGKHAATCETCHRRSTPTRELRMPHGHAACSGRGCHATAGGPAPALATCDGCHRLGLAAERLAKRTAAPWTVRTTFGHARHGAGAAACATCHTKLEGAQLLDVPTPAKATCAPCHDGRAAFKLTGTTCRKCHAPAASAPG